MIGTGLDITERRQAEQEIRHLSSFPQLNPNPVLEVDTAGIVIFCNPGAIRSLEQLACEPDARLFLPADMDKIIQDLEQHRLALARREVAIGNAVFAESIYLAPGFGTIRIFATDITERKYMEEALRQFNAELQTRNVELDAYAHSVAHDIKNPLHLLIGYAAVLAENHARLPAEWPRALGYQPWVEEVWANYLSNALKFAGRPPRIELGGERLADGLVRFWIHDNGDGIAPAKQALLFTAFYQPVASSSGHGLGLSIVKRIMEKLGGEVAVQSSGVPGEGSIFSFTLPAA